METARPQEVYTALPNDDAWTDGLTGQRDSDDSGYMEGGEEEELLPPPAGVRAQQGQHILKSVRRKYAFLLVAF